MTREGGVLPVLGCVCTYVCVRIDVRSFLWKMASSMFRSIIITFCFFVLFLCFVSGGI